MPINVSIVEDNDQLRGTLARVIDRAEGFQCLSQYSNAEAALESLPKMRPFIQVAGGDHLAILLRHEHSCVVRPLHPPADDADDDASGRRRPALLAQSAGGNDQWRGDGCAGRGEKMAT